MVILTQFVNSVCPDEVAHYEPPHQDVYCLSSSLLILNIIQLHKTIFKIFADVNFVVCFFGASRVQDQVGVCRSQS